MLKFRPSCSDLEARKDGLKCLSKDTTKWREQLLNRDHVNDNPGALTTRHAAD